MKTTLTSSIRNTLLSIIKHRQWCMENGFGEKTAARCAAISHINNELNLCVNGNDHAHLAMLRRLKGSIAQVMPGMGSRHRNLREKITRLLEYAETLYNPTHHKPTHHYA